MIGASVMEKSIPALGFLIETREIKNQQFILEGGYRQEKKPLKHAFFKKDLHVMHKHETTRPTG